MQRTFEKRTINNEKQPLGKGFVQNILRHLHVSKTCAACVGNGRWVWWFFCKATKSVNGFVYVFCWGMCRLFLFYVVYGCMGVMGDFIRFHQISIF